MGENEIKIGDQTWTNKNLDVETYRNGDEIPQVKDKEEWANLTTGAWCYYDNNPTNGPTYGKLYNWYAVNDARGLAPNGYHIPTDAEWTILIDNIGDKAGKQMKSKSGWLKYVFSKHDGNGTNSIGFAGLPGGYHHILGFNCIGSNGYWWSSSEDLTCYALIRYLSNNNGDVDRVNFHKQYGFSVRCLRD